MVMELDRVIKKNNVAVVNSAMEFVDIVDWTKAATLIVAEEAYTLIPRSDGSLIRSPNLTIEFPLVIGLRKYVNVYGQQKMIEDDDVVSKKTILIRDDWTCQYCNEYGNTVDHIMPKSRGGGNTWGNLCCACKSCNGKKSDSTPEEVGFTRPVIPKIFLPKKTQMIQEAIYERLMATV